MKRSTPSATPKSPTRLESSTVSWTIPRPTDVLSYSYLWHRESEQGREEGVKDRPVVVVVARQQRPHGTEVVVVPVTTKPSRGGDVQIEIPARIRAHLGLGGDDRCWIVATEVNRFIWPGPDIRPIRRGDVISPRYGSIPARLFEQLRGEIERVARAGELKITKRTG